MTTNHQRVTEGLDILTGVLAPYVAAELRARYAGEWWDQGVLRVLWDDQKRGLPPGGADGELTAALDAHRCLILIDEQWNDLFRRKLGREHRTWVKELKGTRNKWAHKGLLDMADEDAWRALDTMTRMVEQIDAEAVERLRALARIVRYGAEGPSTAARGIEDAQAPGPGEEARTGVLAAVPRQGLRPWREVARPHPDVAAGRYRQAEFAADLSQVARGTAEVEYQDPVEFFARTYLTEGIRGLLAQALRRISGQGGEPVIQLKTAFGGGKTHSLLALYHLLRGRAPLARLPQVADLLKEAGIGEAPRTRVVVLVGTALNPTRERRPPNMPRIAIRTLWGEIGAQLADQAGDWKLYDHVRNADRKGVPPGSDALRALFDACGPCLILIDELVAYARKIYGVEGLPAGGFEAVQTFIQELTEAVRASRNTALVATVPESDVEIGGAAGRETLARIEHTFGRMEAVWKPVGSEEGFEVVRRRLFLLPDDELARDDVCRAFGALYRDGGGEFPPECREARYLERMRACYPIHPEVFDRLYNDWATLERFQRTRGVLRLMAAAIHGLSARKDTRRRVRRRRGHPKARRHERDAARDKAGDRDRPQGVDHPGADREPRERLWDAPAAGVRAGARKARAVAERNVRPHGLAPREGHCVPEGHDVDTAAGHGGRRARRADYGVRQAARRPLGVRKAHGGDTPARRRPRRPDRPRRRDRRKDADGADRHTHTHSPCRPVRRRVRHEESQGRRAARARAREAQARPRGAGARGARGARAAPREVQPRARCRGGHRRRRQPRRRWRPRPRRQRKAKRRRGRPRHGRRRPCHCSRR